MDTIDKFLKTQESFFLENNDWDGGAKIMVQMLKEAKAELERIVEDEGIWVEWFKKWNKELSK